jgi:hypothetical protein
MTLAQRLPDPDALAAIRALADPGWLVVHRGRVGADAQAWEEAHLRLGLPAPVPLGRDLVYRLPGSGGALRDALLRSLSSPPPRTTIGGLPRAEVPEEARRGTLSAAIPETFSTDRFVWLWTDVRNDGSATWPGLTVGEEGGVGLRVRWRSADGGAVRLEGRRFPLARDLAPGESVRAQAGSWVPPPGDYDLEIGVVQSGSGWFADTGGDARLKKRVEVTAAP